ncbi:MAG TPA: hypothetical protein VGR49_00415 [Actinomycetota bacterium]|nr:hypothetical protein [Actinomycetota bacterium]
MAGQPERAGAETHVEPAAAGGLGHREPLGEEEQVAKADVQDPDGFAAMAARTERITVHHRASSSNDHPHCPGFTPIRIMQERTSRAAR